jgi:hypothetical protein
VFGFGLLDICTAILFICALAWAVALAVCALGLIAVGVCLIAAPAFPANTLIIPYMPYVAGALFGAALIALGVVFAMLTIYCAMLIKKSTAAFARWQKNSISAKRALPYVIFPLVEGKPRRILRRINLIAVAAAALLLSAGFALMATQAGAVEFWHVWGWFNYIG